MAAGHGLLCVGLWAWKGSIMPTLCRGVPPALPVLLLRPAHPMRLHPRHQAS